VIADRRLQLENGRQDYENRPPVFDTFEQYRALSANSGDAFRQKSSYFNDRPPLDNYRPPLAPPLLDNFRNSAYSSGKNLCLFYLEIS
jgi:hypothetical protein